jgi:hypothetical protein
VSKRPGIQQNTYKTHHFEKNARRKGGEKPAEQCIAHRLPIPMPVVKERHKLQSLVVFVVRLVPIPRGSDSGGEIEEEGGKSQGYHTGQTAR